MCGHDDVGCHCVGGLNGTCAAESAKDVAWTPCKDIRDALGSRFTEFGERLAGWQADCMGCVHNKQIARNPPSFFMGDDLCLRAQWELRRVWRVGQHVQVLLSSTPPPPPHFPILLTHSHFLLISYFPDQGILAPDSQASRPNPFHIFHLIHNIYLFNI